MSVRDKVGDIIETEIKDLAFDGKSVGNNQGKIVFLDGGLPGEKVRAEIIRTKARFAVGRVLEVIEKSDSRIEPVCPHFDICGGCTWQDLEYDAQLFYKRKQVVDCLEHIGKLKDITVDKTVPAPDLFFYRNKMEYSFNEAGESGVNLGLHHRGRYDKIFDLTDCRLQSPTANEIVRFFREFAVRNAIPAYHITDHTGLLRFLMIREGKNTGQIMINLVTSGPELPYREQILTEIKNRFPQVVTMVQNINSRPANIARGESEEVLFGPGYIEENILGKTFRIYANSFFQTNSLQMENLYTLALEFLAPDDDEKVIDFYCGSGTIGICAADRVAGVIGIEIEPEAIKAARENAGINGIKNIDFVAGSVQDILHDRPEILADATCAVVDPPRAGLHLKALKRLMALDLKRIVYISCNPATLARDAAILTESGYDMMRVKPVDMFPHTMHIELVTGFEK